MKAAVVLLFLLCSGHAFSAFPIEHWVVVMMENRSFDHMLGFLKRDHNQQIDGLWGNETNPVNPFDPQSPQLRVNSNSPYVDPNAGHSYESTMRQAFGGANRTYLNPAPMNGFVADAESLGKGWGPEVMSCFNSTSLPVLSTLALEYGLFDRWYSSIPGPTEPNRAFLQSCSSYGYIDNNEWELGIGFPQRTLMAALSNAGYSWKVYYEVFPTAFFMRELREYPFNYHGISTFEADCSSGKLPTYSFVEPSYFSILDEEPANDQHPSHNVEDGEIFLKRIYEAVRASPAWNKTALIITYDEHGGYYDHSPTPLDGVPNPDGINSPAPYNFKFDRLGIRVPTVVVSPWINKNTLIHEPDGPTANSKFEHCSIAATLRKVLNVPTLPLNKRDAWAGSFEKLFLERTSPRTDCPMKLPNPPKTRASGLKQFQSSQAVNDLQRGMMATANSLFGNREDISQLTTEREGGLFTQQKVAKFLELQKLKMNKNIQDNEL